jgi:hypothetical protein
VEIFGYVETSPVHGGRSLESGENVVGGVSSMATQGTILNSSYGNPQWALEPVGAGDK